MSGDLGSMVDRIDNETEQDGTQDTEIKNHINDAIRFYRGRSWWFLEGPTSAALTSSTAASNSYVSRYTGLIQLDSLRITINGYKQPLEQVSFEEMENLHDGTDSTGQPYKYCLHGDRVRLWPTPNAIYTLTWSGTFEESALSADGDTNDWMTHGELVVRHRARMTFYRDVLIDLPAAASAQAAMLEAEASLTRESLRRTATRRLRAAM